MKKASDIVLLVSGIVGFVAAGCLFITAVMFTIFSLPFFTDIVRSGIEQGTINTDFDNIDAAMVFVISTFISCAVCFYFVSIIMIVASCIFLKARKQGTRGLYITSIVFGAISGLEGGVVGGIFGLFGTKNDTPKPEDVVIK